MLVFFVERLWNVCSFTVLTLLAKPRSQVLYRSRIHEQTILLRFLDITLKVLRQLQQNTSAGLFWGALIITFIPMWNIYVSLNSWKKCPQLWSKRFRLEFQKGSDWSSKKVQPGVPKWFRLEFQKGSDWSSKKVQTGVPKSYRLELHKRFRDWSSKKV